MQKIISIVLTILILASSTGVTYAKHFCGDFEVISTITLGEKDLSCGMKMDVKGCDNEIQEDHHCCKNKYENIDTDDNYSLSLFDLQINVPFIASFVPIFIFKQFSDNSQALLLYANYKPPPIGTDLSVLYQVFTI